jgi:hypothetical protein
MEKVMKHIPALVLSMLIATPALAGHDEPYVEPRSEHGEHCEDPAERAKALLGEAGVVHGALDRELGRIEQLAGSNDWRSTRELQKSARRAREMRRRLASIEDELGKLALLAQERPQRASPRGYSMSEGQFGELMSALRNESWTDGKMAILRDVARYNQFTVDQVRAVMGQFAFGDDKVEAAALLYPKTVDRDRWYQVYAALTFGSDKDALRQRTS